MRRSKYDGFFKKDEKFGDWTIESSDIVMDGRGRAFIHCVCSCGRIITVACHHLVRGRTTRCENCNNSYSSKGMEKNPNWQGQRKVPKTILTKISSSAAHNNIPYNLTMNYVSTLYSNSGQQCAYSGLPINTMTGGSIIEGTAVLARINSSDGYVEGNMAWVHKDVVRKHSPDEFINLCLRVAAEHQFKNKQQVGGSNESQESKESTED